MKKFNFSNFKLEHLLMLAMIMIMSFTLCYNAYAAYSNKDLSKSVPQVYEEAIGETENDVSYEVVYVQSHKFIVFKYSGDIEIVRLN